MVDQAEARGLVLAEGFHYVFHPMFVRALELLDEGVVGEIEHLEVQFDGGVPSGPEGAIYLDPTLGGGVLLHQACYALHAIRSLARTEPDVVRATAKIGDTGVDEAIDVELVLPSGATARARSSMEDGKELLMQATVRGSRAIMTLDNFIGPHYGNVVPSLRGSISVTTDRATLLDESFAGETTYWYQLRAFCDAVAGGSALPVQGEGAVANMMLIDEAAPRLRSRVTLRPGSPEPDTLSGHGDDVVRSRSRGPRRCTVTPSPCVSPRAMRTVDAHSGRSPRPLAQLGLTSDSCQVSEANRLRVFMDVEDTTSAKALLRHRREALSARHAVEHDHLQSRLRR